jgi:uncharacterized protein (TIGR03067 family)
MNHRRLIALAAILLLAAAPPDDATKADRDKFLGTWEIASLEAGGKKESEANLKDLRMVYTADGYTLKMGRETVVQGTYTLDPTKSPKAIDLKDAGGPDRGKAQLGIYQFEGDTLKICVEKAGEKRRPAVFATRPNTGLQLMVLRRAKS